MLRACKHEEVNILLFKSMLPYPLRKDIIEFKILQETQVMTGYNVIKDLKLKAISRYMESFQKMTANKEPSGEDAELQKLKD